LPEESEKRPEVLLVSGMVEGADDDDFQDATAMEEV